jgi:hypothetical protein
MKISGMFQRLIACQEADHYPAAYSEPNDGAFAVLVNAWLNWTLKRAGTASRDFMGADCGLCSDSKRKIQMKNLPWCRGERRCETSAL